MKLSPKTEERDGWLWPVFDRHCFGYEDDVPAWVLARVPGRRTVVQAGGNCGQYVVHYAAAFERVVTFEPDPLNFRCLVHNADALNVHFFNAFLSDGSGDSYIARDLKNNGAHFLWPGALPEGSDGAVACIPRMRLDSLNLSAVDLIHLDIEGHEIPALWGASQTIERCRPWLALEYREDHAGRYGVTRQHHEGMLNALGYALAGTYLHEELWSPL